MRNEIISFTVGVFVGISVTLGYSKYSTIRQPTKKNEHLVNAEKALD